MRQDAEKEAKFKEWRLGAQRFDPDTLEIAAWLYGQRVTSMVYRLLDEIEQRERLLLLCTK